MEVDSLGSPNVAVMSSISPCEAPLFPIYAMFPMLYLTGAKCNLRLCETHLYASSTHLSLYTSLYTNLHKHTVRHEIHYEDTVTDTWKAAWRFGHEDHFGRKNV